MSYAKLLQEWRAGVLPARESVGGKREAPNTPNEAPLPVLPSLPGTKPGAETKAEPSPVPVQALVNCGQCQYFMPNQNNPVQDLGQCSIAAHGDRPPWPKAPRLCSSWNPTPTALLEICRAACDDLAVDAEELAKWLAAQGDEQWMTPPAVKWWAELIRERGWPDD